MKKFSAISLATLILCLFAIIPAFAQQGSANLAGIVKDDQGNPLPGVSVTAKNVATGLERNDVTSDAGSYRFPSLPVGAYDLTAHIQGFATQVQKGIKLSVATTITVDFNMKLSATAETMEISGETPLVETTESHVDTVVTPEQVENLPLNLRQFANLGVMAPGTLLKVNNDPTRPNNLAISTVGGSGRNYNTTIDGGDNNDDTIGGINQFFPLDAVAEFTFQTNLYKAEYGRANGGVLNVVTKTGTNSFSGSGFGLFRSEWMNSETTTEQDQGIGKQPYDRQQYGGSVGGPIVKDKAHFFASIERQATNQEGPIDTGGIVPSLDGTTIPVPQRDLYFTGKGTVSINPQQYLTVRYGQQKTTAVYGNAPNYAPDARGDVTNNFHSFLASHNYVISGDKLNEFVFQYADFKDVITPTSNDPTINFPNGTYLGQNLNTPQFTEQNKWQFKDDYSFTFRSSHHFKTGINFVHEPTLGGSFSSNVAAPLYTPTESSLTSPITQIQQFSGEFGNESPNNQYGIYFQDDWNVNQHLTFNLGLRYDLVSGFNIDQSSSSLFQGLHSSPQNYSWLAAFQESSDGRLHNDTNNFAPRIGAVYDWNADGTTVVRGGFGIYYDFPYTNANILFPQAALGNYGQSYNVVDPNGIRNPDGTLFQIGDPLPTNQLPGLVTAPNDVASPAFVVPYTRQYSVGFSHQIGQNSAIDADYNRVEFRDQFLRFRANGYTIPFDANSKLLPDFGNFRVWFNGGFADYNGFSVSYRSRVSAKLQLQAAYTLAKVEGNTLPGSDEFRLGEPRNLGGCRDCALDFMVGPKDNPAQQGPLDTDARHRIVLSAIGDLPWGLQLSGFFRANSKRPYNVYVTESTDGNRFNYSLAPGQSNVNGARGSGFSQLDLRVQETFSLSQAFRIQAILEVFNVFNAENPTNFIGDVGDPAFGTPISFAGDPGQGEQRVMQLGFRVEF